VPSQLGSVLGPAARRGSPAGGCGVGGLSPAPGAWRLPRRPCKPGGCAWPCKVRPRPRQPPALPRPRAAV